MIAVLKAKKKFRLMCSTPIAIRSCNRVIEDARMAE
jgi:hypothetical protein